MKPFFKMSSGAKDVGRVDIYDEIGFWGTSAAQFARGWKELEASSKRIDLHISSPGGSLFDAIAIYNIVQQSAVPVDIYVDGIALSAASLIAMAGRKTVMAENALLMLHNPYTVTVGDKAEHESSIRALEAATDAAIVAYANKSGKSNDEIRAILDAETWYGADEAKDAGFVDKVSKAVPMAARFDVAAYGYAVPESFRDRTKREEPEAPATEEVFTMSETTKPEPTPASIAEIKSACDGCDNDFVVAQMESGATAEQANSAWMKVLSARTKAAEEKAATAEREKAELLAKSAAPRTGVDPVGSLTGGLAPETTGDPIATWDDAVAEKIKSGMSKPKAISALVREEPELHKAYLAAVNAK